MKTPIDRVWEFYTDIKHLEIISPKGLRLNIINATSEKLSQGSEIWLEVKLLISKTSWHSVITSLKPSQCVDEMLTGHSKKMETFTLVL